MEERGTWNTFQNAQGDTQALFLTGILLRAKFQLTKKYNDSKLKS